MSERQDQLDAKFEQNMKALKYPMMDLYAKIEELESVSKTLMESSRVEASTVALRVEKLEALGQS